MPAGIQKRLHDRRSLSTTQTLGPQGCFFFLRLKTRADSTCKLLLVLGACNLQKPSDSGKLKAIYAYNCAYCVHVYIYKYVWVCVFGERKERQIDRSMDGWDLIG